MAHPEIEFKLYPQQEVPGGRWGWVVERLKVAPGKEKLSTKPEARKVFYAKILEAHEAGYVVHASIIDQTGAGHATTYHLNGTMEPETTIPATTGDLGPRCSLLPRGADQKGNGAGGVSASRRRKTLAARTTWDDLYDALKAGKLKIAKDGRILRATAKEPAVVANLGDFQYCASRIMAQAKDAKVAGSFPGSFALPEALLRAGAPRQRTEAQVLARAASAKTKTPAARPVKPKKTPARKPPKKTPARKPTPKAKTPAVVKPTTPRGATPVIRLPTPKAPTPRAPTPRAPTPVAVKIPTPRAPTPRAPTPQAPRRTTAPVLPGPTVQAPQSTAAGLQAAVEAALAAIF